MSGPVYRLDERLDLRAATPLARDLLALRGADLLLDATAVRHIGAPALQVIRAAARTWAEDGFRFGLQTPSDEMVEQLHLLGFTADSLTLWEAHA